ncbi:FAD dependent oxidoreductase [Fragilaria crotonensis]|nr:FAD dependent oxidoreductase [Fragilaria crotonensis]
MDLTTPPLTDTYLQKDYRHRRFLLLVALILQSLEVVSPAWRWLTTYCRSRGVHVTIYDKAVVGQGGASSVAGGLLHPLSPRGKVVHWGLEGLASTSRLVDSASCFSPHCVLRDKLYRVALTEENVATLKATASLDISRWMEKDEMDAVLGSNSMGGLELSMGVV